MDIPLNKLTYSFKNKPILVGGRAMEYYGLRKSGKDIDLIATEEDVLGLVKLYPTRVKDLWGDLGVCPFEFEIWKTIRFFDYSFYRENSIEKENYLIVSMEKLLFMKTLAIEKEKYLKDVMLIVQGFVNKQNQLYKKITTQNKQLLEGIEGIVYIEKTGAE
jgi:hypothetical protein